MADNRVADNRVADNRVADNRVADNRVADNRVADNRVADNRVADNRVADNRVADNRVADNQGLLYVQDVPQFQTMFALGQLEFFSCFRPALTSPSQPSLLSNSLRKELRTNKRI